MNLVDVAGSEAVDSDLFVDCSVSNGLDCGLGEVDTLSLGASGSGFDKVASRG